MAVDFSRQAPIASSTIFVVIAMLPGAISLPMAKTMLKIRAFAGRGPASSLVRILARSSAADGFLRDQVTQDPSPRVRTAIVQTIAADARWSAMPDTGTLIERVVASDPDHAVSIAALEASGRRATFASTSLGAAVRVCTS